MDFELERFMHLHAMNRGILLTPFHNMALMSPQTEADDVDRHTKVFRDAVKELLWDRQLRLVRLLFFFFFGIILF